MSKLFPLLIGDEVRPVSGRFAGRTGRVSDIEPDGERIHIYFGTRRNEHSSGGLTITMEADWFSSAELLFRGRLASESIVCLTTLAGPPPGEPGLEAAALQAIWDDAPRLLYADWLDERSDPHAEYLRVQVALGHAVRAGEPFEPLADRERRLRALLNPDWLSRFRRLTTEPPPFEVAALDPAYAAHARTALRLHPRAGEVPELAGSKLGGLFLWPEDEPWPTAAGLEVEPIFSGLGPFPDNWSTENLTPILQLARRDVPQLAFPPGADIMQMFWCPFMTGMHAPEPFVFWRNSSDVRTPRRDPPKQGTAELSEGLIPTPCRLYPEVITEYPATAFSRTSSAVLQAVADWAANWPSPSSSFGYWWNRCTGWKVGGYPWGNQSDGVRFEFATQAGKPLDYLLQVSQSELDHTNWRWCPVEDRNLCVTGNWLATAHEAGGLRDLTRGNYHLLIDRTQNPWRVRSFYDSSG